MQADNKPRRVIVCREMQTEQGEAELVTERPLTVWINDRELVTLLTDFSHPDELALGFLRNEGLLDEAGQVQSLRVDEKTGEALVKADLSGDLIEAVYGKRMISSGCGKGSVFYHVLDSVKAGRVKVKSEWTMPLEIIYDRAEELSRRSQTYRRTHGVHTAALLNSEGVLVFREDIGRHNALDKVAGWALRNGTDLSRCAVYTTGRITSEVMLKAGRMEAPIILSRGTPTSLALELGEQIGLTVVGYLRGRRCKIYLNEQRIVIPEE